MLLYFNEIHMKKAAGGSFFHLISFIFTYLFCEFEFIRDLLSDLNLLIHTLFHISFRFLGSAVPFLSVSAV